MEKDLKKLSDLYVRLLQIESELVDFETKHPRLEAVKQQTEFIIKMVDDARHSLRDLWERLKNNN